MTADSLDVVRILQQCLAEGKTVELEGLGIFRPGGRFELSLLPKVFIAYVEEDAAKANRLFDALECRGYQPWLDRRKLLPGQNWARSIEDAIENSDFFLAIFSSHSVDKRGGFQAEIRYALDCARRTPLDQIFLVPVRLDNCRIPRRIQRETQYIDLFPDWGAGVARLLSVLRTA